MTELFRVMGYSVFFSSQDMHHGVHVHVGKGRKRDLSKFILTKDGHAFLAHNRGGLSDYEVSKIEDAVEDRYKKIVDRWSYQFGSDYHFDK
ncbi:DUF4160 domain-containing protein [Bifidobacterium sp. ESL0690]|uniref:DUF4160 domain-containing protein n=1 Tax=Bifidobacterium sp. ESL0690 TaxID=2983214 RepID=UPI0023F68B3C|nr:DUF4160 domain-containing protein [Bifidobacterium sp. ESL0690]WEV46934.1 DUF4160 domain-containing protein [Bifidobacterium sp. ESL0690]